jgi:hypothetical protein
MMVKKNLEHAFSIELKNRRHVKHIFVSDEVHERVLFEGSLGILLGMSLVEGDVFDLIGVNGVLKLSLTREQLQETKAAESSLGAEEGRPRSTQTVKAGK